MDELIGAMAGRDLARALDILLEWDSNRIPRVRTGYGRESHAWDFKAGLPGLRAENEIAWAKIAADLAAFHNVDGGMLLFGITDREMSFVGTRDVVDAKRFNDRIRRYLGDGDHGLRDP